MGKTDHCVVLCDKEKAEANSLFMDTVSLHTVFLVTCSPEAVYYTWMISFALCFNLINFIYTCWQWKEIPSGILTYSSLLTEFFPRLGTLH